MSFLATDALTANISLILGDKMPNIQLKQWLMLYSLSWKLFILLLSSFNDCMKYKNKIKMLRTCL